MTTTTPNPLNLPITTLAGVGKAVARQLSQLGISRIFDLLLHLPRDYEDRSRRVAINQLIDGQSALIEGKVTYVNNRSGMSVTFADDTGSLILRFFKVYRGLSQTMQKGVRLRVFGEVKINRYGVQMHHPEFTIISPNMPTEITGLQPIYPTVKGLYQNKLRTLIRLALQEVQKNNLNHLTILTAIDWQNLPQKNLQAIGNLTLFEALTLLHTPPTHADISKQMQMLEQIKERQHLACKRIIIEELTAHQLSLLYRRQQLQHHKAPICNNDSPLAKKLVANLPFTLTNAQQKVIEEIRQDLATAIPMLRLVQGDVGAGKTLVSALSACYALDSGWQVALMAPTEILAEQHLMNFKKWFQPLGVQVGWLVGKQKVKERREALQAIAENKVQLIIGTHALFQEQVQFAKLGLVIIDEQHRFGVEQRMALTDKGVENSTPHQLVMTATPIPRTLAMSAYGDMDSSIIDELPPNRTPITTVTIDRNRRDEVLQRIEINCKQGKQAYWVCPLVEESSELDAQSAEATFADVSKRLNIRIGLVHGKMKANEKQQTMQDFKDGNLDMLIATTVIEVGVDVPNASLMVIENAERLGLSQLHQLRGRVGRGSEKSFCVLLYQTPLSETGIERLKVLADSNDGFVIAQKDLQLRGAGELLGKKQTGNINYYLADVVRDEQLFVIARNLAKKLINDSKRTADVKNLIQRWLPDAEKFINV
ncbi:MAG: ATP-dependent DNA helicase RecG [Moraxellaceae bacterium]|nr:ATP-dependent DNA helicase RecG [Moraxellaceae bacterium]